MLTVKINNFGRVILTLIILPIFVFGQVAGTGTVSENAGAAGAGKVASPIAKKLYSTINKQVFVRLAQKTVKKRAAPKTQTARSVQPNTNSKNSLGKNPSKNIQLPTANSPQNQALQSVLTFQPGEDTGFDQELSDLLTQKPEEKEGLLLIFRETKKSFQSESQKLGRENDLALAITFFISTCLMVYHQTPEPGDEAAESLYQSVAESMWETPEIGQMSNQEKHLASDKLIYVSGLILTGYLSSKESGDQATLQSYRQIAADCFESFTGLKADSIKLD
jgi:hypothetical protein